MEMASVKNLAKKKAVSKNQVARSEAIPLQQTKAWQKLQEELGEECFYREERDYRFLAIKKQTLVGSYLYLPYGPVAKNQKAFNLAVKELKKLAEQEKAFFIRIEPQNRTLKLPKNVKKSKDLNPADTWVLDLTPEKPEIITNFSQGTRTRYNTYAKKGIVVEKTKDPSGISHLVRLQAELARNRGINTFSKDYLAAELKQPFATLYLVKYCAGGEAVTSVKAEVVKDERAETAKEKQVKTAKNKPDLKAGKNPQITEKKPTPKNGEIIAASLFFDDETTRYYMQSAANDNYRHLPATVALLTTALFDAKDKGLCNFDFWGIAPENADQNHPWQGFTEFKKSFGGEARHYQGTYDLPLNPFKYKLYQILRKINLMRRKM